MDEEIIGLVKQALGVSEVPEGFEDFYKKFRIMADRIDAGKENPAALVMICLMFQLQPKAQPIDYKGKK